MKKLNSKKVNQKETFRLIDKEINKIYIEFLDSIKPNSYSKFRKKFVKFTIWFVIKEGSVLADIFIKK